MGIDFSTASWKTTSAGLLSIIGGMVRIGFAIANHQLTEEALMTTLTGVIAGVGLLFARDVDRSSVDAGIQSVEPKNATNTVVTDKPDPNH